MPHLLLALVGAWRGPHPAITVTRSSLLVQARFARISRVKILSVQSSVAYGHVGNSAAVFPLQRLGHEVWPVLTVHFSNHTGYGEWRGPVLAASDVADVIAGIQDRGVLGQADAVLSGYQGDPAVGAVILDTVERVKELNPDAVYCCDPVMGDVGRGMFVRPGIPEFMRDSVVPTGRHPHPEPLRARLPGRPGDPEHGRGPGRRRRGPRPRPTRRTRHQRAARRPRPRLARRGRGLGRRRLGADHARCCRSPRTAAATSPPRSTSPTCVRRAPRPPRSPRPRRRCSRSSRRRSPPAPARSSSSPPRTRSPNRP